MTAHDFQEAHDGLRKVGGEIRAPEVPTCTNGNRVIDFVVVDRRIAGAVHIIFTDLEFAAGSAHHAVVVRLACKATRAMVRKLAKPRPFPPDRPIGCTSKPREPDPKKLAALEEASRDNSSAVEDAYEHLVGLAEAEWCRECDCVDAQGLPDSGYLGRSGSPRYIWKQAYDGKGGKCARSNARVRTFQWIANRLKEMAGMLDAIGKGQVKTPPRRAQWAALARVLTLPTQEMRGVLEQEKGAWGWRIQGASHLSVDDAFAAAALREWASEAKALAQKESCMLAQAATKAWWRFVDDQMRAGAGVLHRVTKRVAAAAEKPVPGLHGPTLDLQAVLEEDRRNWQTIWERFKDTASAPWRDHNLDVPPFPALPEIVGSDLVDVALTYKRRTGLGVDSLHPRWFAWLSFPVLDGLAKLLNAAERLGVWPLQVQIILMAQLPKGDGGWRPIGLLPTLVRLWERVR